MTTATSKRKSASSQFDLDEEKAFLKDIATESLRNGGSLVPTFVGFSKDTPVRLITGMPWANDEEKDRLLTALRATYTLHQVDRYMMVSEVWQSKNPEHKGAPSEDPERTEHLAIVHVDDSGCSYFTYEITRKDDGAVSFGPERVLTKVKGRMAELLPFTGTPTIPPELRFDFQTRLLKLMGLHQEILQKPGDDTDDVMQWASAGDSGREPSDTAGNGNVTKLPILSSPLSAARRSTDPL